VKKQISIIIILVLINIFILSAVYVSMADSETEIFTSYDKLVEVETRILNNYVDDITPEFLQQSALKGMLNKLDPYSRFISPAEFKAMQNGEKADTATADVGINLTRENSLVSVKAIRYGSPAYTGNIMIGDKIFEINGELLREPNVFDAEKLLYGEPDTEVKLRIFRPPSTLKTVLLKRTRTEPVNIPAAKIIEDDIGYIKISSFRKDTSKQLREKLVQLHQEGAKAFVLDFRDNGNGIISEGIQTADLFIPEGETITRLQSRLAADEKIFASTPIAAKMHSPLAVLINQGTGEAAEVAAAALKETQRGIVIGQKTFGMAIEQTLIEIEHGAALKLTTGNYYTPLGSKITGEGVEPHIMVEVSVDEQLQRRRKDAGDTEALRQVSGEDIPATTAGDTGPNAELRKLLEENEKQPDQRKQQFVDTQLDKAIDILKALRLYQKAA